MNSKAQDCLSGFVEEISKLKLTELETKHLLEELYMTFFTNDTSDSDYEPDTDDSETTDSSNGEEEVFDIIDRDDYRYKDHQSLE